MRIVDALPMLSRNDLISKEPPLFYQESSKTGFIVIPKGENFNWRFIFMRKGWQYVPYNSEKTPDAILNVIGAHPVVDYETGIYLDLPRGVQSIELRPNDMLIFIHRLLTEGFEPALRIMAFLEQNRIDTRIISHGLRSPAP